MDPSRNRTTAVAIALGSIDILVKNAGAVGPRALRGASDPAVWRRAIDSNLIGTFYCARAAVKLRWAAR